MRHLALLLLIAAPIAAQDKQPAKPKSLPRIALREPIEAAKDPDFAIQGEYEGEMVLDQGPHKVGVQVIARGGGEFAGRILVGGLPGARWDGKTTIPLTAKTEEGKVTFTAKNFTGTIENGKLTIKNDMNVESVLKRVIRKSPTLDAKPAQGAIVLFGGPNDLEKWSNAQIVELSDGKFLACTPGKNILTKAELKNFQMHIEFRLPWMPNSNGQQRGNSGLYLQNRYELQILDSFGLKGENNECGGFYTQYAPKVNMCFPPLTWQTYDIDFTAAEFDAEGKKTRPAKVTVKQNGVVIQDAIELKGPTPGGQKEEDKPGPLHLQWHGDPLVFRNIWVSEAK